MAERVRLEELLRRFGGTWPPPCSRPACRTTTSRRPWASPPGRRPSTCSTRGRPCSPCGGGPAERQGEALEVFARLKDRLREELGVDPGPVAVAAHAPILARDPIHRGNHPAGRSTVHPGSACRPRRRRRSVAEPRWPPRRAPCARAAGSSRSPARAAWASPGCSPTSARRSRPTTTSCTSRCPGTKRETPRTRPRRWPSPRGAAAADTARQVWSAPADQRGGRVVDEAEWCSDPRPAGRAILAGRPGVRRAVTSGAADLVGERVLRWGRCRRRTPYGSTQRSRPRRADVRRRRPQVPAEVVRASTACRRQLVAGHAARDPSCAARPGRAPSTSSPTRSAATRGTALRRTTPWSVGRLEPAGRHARCGSPSSPAPSTPGRRALTGSKHRRDRTGGDRVAANHLVAVERESNGGGAAFRMRPD